MDQILNAQDLSLFEEDYEKRDGLKKLQNNILRHGINESCIDESLYHEMKDVFSVEVKTGKVTNQRQSGRCWMFAGLNVLREILKETLNVKEIELSQAYLQFYDKLEKANFFLEKGLEHADEELDSRDNVFLLDSALGDGGHFHMFTNLVK
ncbi:MAG: aminopeptidase, partial [Bacilli bacterium]|nr:aminopeptidase [Bacilli bacterium]